MAWLHYLLTDDANLDEAHDSTLNVVMGGMPTTATHLLRAGVDINTIRAWLGHASITTTSIYAEVDIEMKAKALAKCEIGEASTTTPWRNDTGLMKVPPRLAVRIVTWRPVSAHRQKIDGAYLNAT